MKCIKLIFMLLFLSALFSFISCDSYSDLVYIIENEKEEKLMEEQADKNPGADKEEGEEEKESSEKKIEDDKKVDVGGESGDVGESGDAGEAGDAGEPGGDVGESGGDEEKKTEAKPEEKTSDGEEDDNSAGGEDKSSEEVESSEREEPCESVSGLTVDECEREKEVENVIGDELDDKAGKDSKPVSSESSDEENESLDKTLLFPSSDILFENESSEEISENPDKSEAYGEENSEYDIVAPVNVIDRKWSILVYMGADNNLEASAIEDLYEMEMSGLNTQQTSVLVLLDRSDSYDTSNGNWSGAKLFKLKTGRVGNENKIISEELDCEALSLKKGKSVELDMSSGLVLESAISFMKEEFPAEHYGLVIWGHGTGWRSDDELLFPQKFKGFAYDDSTKTYMTLKQLGTSLQRAAKGRKFDFLGFDTCFGSEIEVLYELKEYSEYIVGSECLLLYSGWNYKRLFDYFQQDNYKTAENLAKAVVVQFSEQFKSTPRASICAVKTDGVNELFSSFDQFTALCGNLITNRKIRDEVMGILYSNLNCDTERYCYGGENSDIYLDLASMTRNLNLYFESKSSLLSASFSNLTNALNNAIIYSWASDRNDMKGGISDNKAGIGLYFSTLGINGTLLTVHPANYIKNKTSEQITFVQDSVGYVPVSSVASSSLLDKLFYTLFK